jgi:hypothetical protein
VASVTESVSTESRVLAMPKTVQNSIQIASRR